MDFYKADALQWQFPPQNPFLAAPKKQNIFLHSEMPEKKYMKPHLHNIVTLQRKQP